MPRRRAVIEWIPKEQGGRSRPPAGVGSPPYAPVVRFTEPEEPWPPPIAWTLVVEKDEALSGPLRWISDVRFLVEDAPHEALRSGRRFELYEGPRCVARGRILDDGVPEEQAIAAASSA